MFFLDTSTLHLGDSKYNSKFIYRDGAENIQ